MDQALPDAGALMQLMDAETGLTQWVDTGSAFCTEKYEEHFL